MTNEELLAKFRDWHDKRAFDDLQRACSSRTLVVCIGVAGFADADDLNQETWIKIIRFSGGFDAKKDFVAWACQIARNTALDWLRRKNRSPFIPLEDFDAAEERGFEEFREAFYQAWYRLTDEERFILDRFHLEGWSQAKIGQHFGVCDKTARTRLHEAESRFRKFWQEENESP